jgi:cation transport regulator ChaB
MPFSSNEELVKKVKGTGKLSDKKQRQFRHIFNQCFKDKGDSGSCYAQAWGAVRKSASERMEILKQVDKLPKKWSRRYEELRRTKGIIDAARQVLQEHEQSKKLARELLHLAKNLLGK